MVCWVFNSFVSHLSFWLYTQVRGRVLVLCSICVGLLSPLFLAFHQSSAWSEDCPAADGCRSSPCSSPFSAHLHCRPCLSGLFFPVKDECVWAFHADGDLVALPTCFPLCVCVCVVSLACLPLGSLLGT